MMLSSVFHTGPVTALACIGGAILAGIGSRLHVYKFQPIVQHIGTHSVLPGRVIHGIRESCSSSEGSRLCIFGQKCLRVIHFCPGSCEVKVSTEMVEFSDWIWDVAWLEVLVRWNLLWSGLLKLRSHFTRPLIAVESRPSKTPFEGGDRLGLALGHNVIVIWDLVDRNIATTVHCAEKCILYCARFLTNRRDCLVLAAGTVFNQVVLWSPCRRPNPQGHQVPFHRLTGHQGVIFSVDYNPMSKRICSVSDDRSVRLYQMTFPHLDNDCTLSDWEKMETSLIHVLYGHSARVWDISLLSVVFVSVGEDATCCVWTYDGKVIQKFKGHKGKSIWSMAVEKKERFVVTGGGDNSIRLWHLQSQETEAHISTQVLDLQIGPKDFPRSVQFLSDILVLVMTNEGILLLIDTMTKKSRCLMKDEEYASYSALSVSPGKQLVAIGNIHGTLRILYWKYDLFCDPELTDSVIYQDRVFSIIWLDDDHLLTSGPSGETIVWRISARNVDRSVKQVIKFELPNSKHRWASAAIFSHDMRYVICGDRAGSVLLYNLEGKLVQMFPKIHKADVTQVCLHGDHVYTAGRDGMYRLYVWGEDQLVLLNSSKVFKGFVWIEGLLLTEEGDMLIQGFNANKFIVWSVQQNQKLIEAESGGGHRSWDFFLNGNKARLLYIKAREVMVKDIQLLSHQLIIKGSLHGRELCDVKHISSTWDPSGRPVHLLATCSEDTMVCLTAVYYNKQNQQVMHILHSLSGHISSVRCLAVCESSMPCSHNSKLNRKLLFSAGGRAQIKIWRLDDNTSKFLETLHHSQSVQNETKDLSRALLLSPNKEQSEHSKTKNDSKTASTVIHNTGCDTKDFQSDFSIPGNIKFSSCQKEEEKAVCTGNEVSKTKTTDSETSREETNRITHCNDGCVSSELDVNVQVDSKNDHGSLISCQYESLAGVLLGTHRKRKAKPWRLKEDNSDPETRILDLTVFRALDLSPDNEETLYFLTAACSDGLIRFFLFEEDSREVTFIAFSNFHDHCVLKVTHVIHKSEQTTSALILSVATDGKVAFWDVTDLCKSITEDVAGSRKENREELPNVSVFLEKKIQSQHTLSSDKMFSGNNASNMSLEENENFPKDSRHKTSTERSNLTPFGWLDCHQSGVNSIYFGPYEASDQYVLVTGGDDNAVHVNLIGTEQLVTKETEIPRKVKVICSGSELSAHAAQITGIWFLSKNCILTASIDQRICIWSFTTHGSDIKLELTHCQFMDVPDIANIDVWRQGDKTFTAVCGEGLEILEISTASLGDSLARN